MTEIPPRSRWGSGFAWGCLTPILIIGVLVLGAIGFGAYYLTFGIKNDPTFQIVMAAVQSNPVAHDVLGNNITSGGSSSYSFRYEIAGNIANYAFPVQGSKGSGSVTAIVQISGSQRQIKVLVLTGPSGQTYNLIGHLPGAPTNAVWLLPAGQIWGPA